jgi:diguanylate cyclase (GGDEF)-like protein
MISTTLMIVEDQAVIAADLETSLLRCGYRVCGMVASGAEAVEMARRERPDLVLMDIRLQGAIDGIETAEKLNRELDAPVIFLTAHTDEEMVQRAKLLAPYGFLVKPFDERELQINVEMALHKHQIERQLAAANLDIHRLNVRLEQQMAERMTTKLELTLNRLRKAERDAYNDLLTGLANRALYMEQLQLQLEICIRNKCALAVLYLDLDGFKSVNDTFGHATGDELLQAVAVRIVNSIRVSDLAARLGGDEFVVMLVQSDMDKAKLVADKLVVALSEPYQLVHHVVTISASIGAASFPETGNCSAALLERADVALYEAKRSGKRRAMTATPAGADTKLTVP